MTTLKLTAAQERALNAALEQQGDKPFRRQDLAALMYPLTRPRSREAADQAAAKCIQRLLAAKRLVKAGHVHWQLVVPQERVLQSGRRVPELPALHDLALKTRCPQKWVSVDLETGDVWVGSEAGWARAPAAVVAEAANCLKA